MVRCPAADDRDAASTTTNRQAARAVSISASHHLDANGLDDVAHVAGRIPERSGRLGLAAGIDGAYLQIVRAFPLRPERRGPLVERIAAVVGADARGLPGLAAVSGEGDLGDALPAVERDAAD